MLTYAEAAELAKQQDAFPSPVDEIVILDGDEDDTHFCIGWEYAPEVDPRRHMLGGGCIFVNKETREVWSSDFPFVADIIGAMTPVKYTP